MSANRYEPKNIDSAGARRSPGGASLVETLDELHRKYLETRDEHFVLLAIGLCPETPPRWATGVCARLAADRRYLHGGVERPKHHVDADREWLDAIADGLLDRAAGTALRTTLQAALATTGLPRRRPALREGQRLTDPLRPAAKLQDAYDLALREIEAGDLNTTIDDALERNRLAQSRWLRIEGPDGELDGGILLRVAPKPEGTNLIRMVKKVLIQQRDQTIAALLGTAVEEPAPQELAEPEPEMQPPLQATMKLVVASSITPSE